MDYVSIADHVLQGLKGSLLAQHEAQSLQSLTQLRAVQGEFERLQQQFNVKITEITATKEREAHTAIAAMRIELKDFEAKFSESQQVFECLAFQQLFGMSFICYMHQALHSLRKQLKRVQEDHSKLASLADSQREADQKVGGDACVAFHPRPCCLLCFVCDSRNFPV
jgi:hypothetical protein